MIYDYLFCNLPSPFHYHSQVSALHEGLYPCESMHHFGDSPAPFYCWHRQDRYSQPTCPLPDHSSPPSLLLPCLLHVDADGGGLLYVVLVRVFVIHIKRYLLAFTLVSYGLPLFYMGLLTLPLGFATPNSPHYGCKDV